MSPSSISLDLSLSPLNNGGVTLVSGKKLASKEPISKDNASVHSVIKKNSDQEQNNSFRGKVSVASKDLLSEQNGKKNLLEVIAGPLSLNKTAQSISEKDKKSSQSSSSENLLAGLMLPIPVIHESPKTTTGKTIASSGSIGFLDKTAGNVDKSTHKSTVILPLNPLKTKSVEKSSNTGVEKPLGLLMESSSNSLPASTTQKVPQTVLSLENVHNVAKKKVDTFVESHVESVGRLLNDSTSSPIISLDQMDIQSRLNKKNAQENKDSLNLVDAQKTLGIQVSSSVIQNNKEVKSSLVTLEDPVKVSKDGFSESKSSTSSVDASSPSGSPLSSIDPINSTSLSATSVSNSVTSLSAPLNLSTPLPMTTAGWQSMIVARAGTLPSGQSILMRTEPEALGPIQMEATLHSDKGKSIHIQLTAHHMNTVKLLQQGIPLITQMLNTNNSGVPVSVSVAPNSAESSFSPSFSSFQGNTDQGQTEKNKSSLTTGQNVNNIINVLPEKIADKGNNNSIEGFESWV